MVRHSHVRWRSTINNRLERLATFSWQRDRNFRLLFLLLRHDVAVFVVLFVFLAEEQLLVVLVRVEIAAGRRRAHRHHGTLLLKIKLHKIIVRLTLVNYKSVFVVVVKAQEHFDVT